MRDNIPAPHAAPNPAATAAAIDTVELFMPRPLRGLRERIEAATGRRAHIEDCRDATGKFRGVRAIFNRPTREACALIERIMQAERGSAICRVDLAVDFRAESSDDADAIADWLDRRLILKWRSAQSAKRRIGETVYWCDARRARNLVVYRNQKSDCIVRLELRFLNSRAVRRAGLDRPERLRAASPIRLFEHNIKAQRLSDRHVRKITRQTFQEDLKRSWNRKTRSHPVTDQYRSRIPARVRAMLNRVDAQSVKNGPGMERASMEWLGIPSHVMWR